MSVSSRIANRASHFGKPLDTDLLAHLAGYFELLKVWNQRVSLTSLPIASDGDEAIDRLILEPLAAARYLPTQAGTLLDVGSGGGSPAIPLKLARADIELTMVESREKKAAFLREVVRSLGLRGTTVLGSRLEQVAPSASFDAVSIRAVRIDSGLLECVSQFVRPGGASLLFQAAADVPNHPD